MAVNNCLPARQLLEHEWVTEQSRMARVNPTSQFVKLIEPMEHTSNPTPPGSNMRSQRQLLGSWLLLLRLSESDY